MPPPATSHLRLVTTDFAPLPGAAPVAPRAAPQRPTRTRKPLGQILIDMKAVDPGDMLKALALRDRQDVRLGDILLAHGWVAEADLMAALANQYGARVLDLAQDAPDPRLLDGLGADFCLAEGILPWRRAGAATVIATARPDEFARLRQRLPEGYGPVIMGLAPETAIHAAVLAMRQTALTRRAETRAPSDESCRSLDTRRLVGTVLAVAACLALLAFVAPMAAFAPLFLWATLTLVLTTALKLAALVSEIRHQKRAQPVAPLTSIARLPVVSILVPLFREDDIAPRLIGRLGKLDYPKELLDILLVVEEDDAETRAALARRPLPRWMRIVTVPSGPIRTKPRALNYALDFCRGSIVGIYDAEDAPDPGQLRAVVQRFHERGPEVACLQGILDFYNSRHNWLTRCFTVEYASLFRVVLPGIARMGLVVPLGGTTLFVRRKALEAVGGWDAHNVTEDADLGVRLARHGYRTELIATVTEEEPNSRLVPWIKQRSRWQKGYAITWAAHMRAPRRLWREIGAKRFFGLQIMLLGGLSQALLAPVLWSYWALFLGLGHPLGSVMTAWQLALLGALFVAAGAVNMTIGLWAVRGAKHRHLMAFVPTLAAYHPLATFASYKALWQVVRAPFYWDKTLHGVVDPPASDTDEAAEPATAPVESPAPLPVLVLVNPLPPPAAPVQKARPVLWTHPAPRLTRPVEPPRASASLVAARPAGIEFQPCFEGF